MHAHPSAEGGQSPFLIGLDFLKPRGAILDISRGAMVFEQDDKPSPMALPNTGVKSLYYFDVVQYLTGRECDSPRHPEGTAQII